MAVNNRGQTLVKSVVAFGSLCRDPPVNHVHHDHSSGVQTAGLEAASHLATVHPRIFTRTVMSACLYLAHDMPLSHCLGDGHWLSRTRTKPDMGLSHCVIAHPSDGCVTPSCPPPGPLRQHWSCRTQLALCLSTPGPAAIDSSSFHHLPYPTSLSILYSIDPV